MRTGVALFEPIIAGSIIYYWNKLFPIYIVSGIEAACVQIMQSRCTTTHHRSNGWWREQPSLERWYGRQGSVLFEWWRMGPLLRHASQAGGTACSLGNFWRVLDLSYLSRPAGQAVFTSSPVYDYAHLWAHAWACAIFRVCFHVWVWIQVNDHVWAHVRAQICPSTLWRSVDIIRKPQL